MVLTQQMQNDLAEGAVLFRERRYEDALFSLERCFLSAFARNDRKHGSESGALLLQTLVALKRDREADGFAAGLRLFRPAAEVQKIAGRSRSGD
jgi:hypothetical protein